MFDIAWTEMLVIAIVMIVVVGPKELPGMLRTIGKTTSKLRTMAGDFRKQFDEALKEADLEDLKKIAEDARSLNPAADIKKALNPLESAGNDVRAGLKAAFNPPKFEPPKPKPKADAPAEPVAAVPAAAPAATPAVAVKSATVATKSAGAKTATSKPVTPKPAPKTAAAKPAAVKPAAVKSAAGKAAPAKKPAAPNKKTGGATS